MVVCFQPSSFGRRAIGIMQRPAKCYSITFCGVGETVLLGCLLAIMYIFGINTTTSLGGLKIVIYKQNVHVCAESSFLRYPHYLQSI